VASAYIYVAVKGITDKITLQMHMILKRENHLLNVLFLYMLKHAACSTYWDFIMYWFI